MLANFFKASSTDVERAFSNGGLTVSKFRHALSDESTRAQSVLSSWFELPGAIPHKEIIEKFKEKSKHLKKKQKVVGSSENVHADEMNLNSTS